ncbi:unnamed protein product, partial [Laminaria digitata]
LELGCAPDRARTEYSAPMFLGRQAELNTLGALMDEGQSLTIYGGPGMGKATLARELTRRSHLRFVEVNLAA